MTRKQALKLKNGDLVRAVVEVPNGADAHGRPGYIPGEGYQKDSIPAGQILVFRGLIPKVCIVNHGPWHDEYAEMLLCEMRPGQRAWLNIRNAEKAQGDTRDS
jgi:hypothetical protein